MISLVLANVDPTRLESVTKSTKMAVTDTLVAFVAGGVICGTIAAWALYRRKRRKRVTGGEKVYRSSPSSAAEEDAGEDEVRRRYKRRVRRRDHRGRNPTLAETGGLPPVRPEHQSGPS